MLGDTEVEKHNKFHQYKSPIPLNDVGVSKVVVHNRVPFGNKVLNILLGTKMVKM